MTDATPGRLPVVAYLVLSHQQPRRVESLASRILELTARGQVVVHHDSADGTQPWSGRAPERAHLLSPTSVNWGDWTIVSATLSLIGYARKSLDADWVVTLSGEDRPIVDLDAWEAGLSSNGADGIVCARPITVRPSIGRRPTPDDINFARYAFRWRPLPQPRDRAGRAFLELARRVSRFTQPLFKIEYAPRRQRWFMGVPRHSELPHGWTIHAGSQWMALSAKAADALLEADTEVSRWFEETWIPDQAFIHTVLYNDSRLRLVNRPVTYVVPQRLSRSRPNWMVLRTEDLDAMLGSGAAFARKFDPGVDPRVEALVDGVIEAHRRAHENWARASHK